VPKPILYVVLALLILSGNAISQEVETAPEAADTAYIAAETDSAAAADSAVAAAPEADSTAVVAAQEPDNIPVIESAAVLEQPIPQPIQQTIQPKRNTLWIAVGADIAGAGILGLGLYEEMNVRDLISRGKFPAAESKETVRNVCYVIGTLVLAAGISIHIFF
jgi:hypothetical protein